MNLDDQKVEKSFINRWAWLFFLLVPAAIYLTCSLLPYFRFMEHRDLHNWVQSSYNTLNGRWFYLSDVGYNMIGIHFSWFMILFTPVLAVFRTPASLLVLQSISLAAAVYVGFRLARRVLQDDRLAALYTTTGLMLHPAIWGAAGWGFYAVNFQTFFLLAGILSFLDQREKRAWLLFILALGCKIDAAILLFLLGFYRVTIRREYFQGASLSIFSLLYFCVAFFWIMPALRGDPALPEWSVRYAYLGETPEQIVGTIIGNPLGLTGLLIGGGKPFYLIALLAPGWFLALLSPFSLIGLPHLLLNMLSNFKVQTSLLGPYNAGIVTVFFVSGLFALKRRKERLGSLLRKKRLFLAISIALLLFFFSLPFAHFLGRQHYLSSTPLTSTRIAAVKEISSLIPPEASLATDIHLAPRLAWRSEIEAPIKDVRELAAGKYDYLFIDLTLLSPERQAQLPQITESHYQTAVIRDGFILLKNIKLK